MNRRTLKCAAIDVDVELPKKCSLNAACLDVRAYFGPKTREITVYTPDNSKINKVAFKTGHLDEPFHILISPRERAMIPTGMILDIPEGHSVRVHPRSGLSVKQGINLINCEGVIDSDYTEQLYIPIVNLSDSVVRICHGDRIAQIEMVKDLEYYVEFTSEAPGQKSDRVGGFGSTGV